MAKSYPNGSRRGKHALADRRRREDDPRVRAAAEETERARRELDELIERQKQQPAEGAVAGALHAAQRAEAEAKIAARLEQEAAIEATTPEAPEKVEANPQPKVETRVVTRKFSVKSLPQEGEGNFPFALMTAKLMLKAGYNIRHVIERTGIGYLELDTIPLDEEGYGIVVRESEDVQS